ncbi:MAG TPA: L,D-transpeptidase [Solimonas sp.]|nr:L,D-transpeptidase [Solimonas sp.]
MPKQAMPRLALGAVLLAAASVALAQAPAGGEVLPLQRGAKGEAVLHAQVLLDRARFPTGEIDASFGSNMQRALQAWQRQQGLSASGKLDGRSWAALSRDTAPPLASYSITEADVAGPFQAIPEDMMEKAALPALGYASAEEALAERFHAAPALLRRLNPDKDFGRVGEAIMVPNVDAGMPLPQGAKVVIDRSDLSVALLDDAGQVLARFPATIGSKHDPPPLGLWKIKGVARNPPFHYNPQLFWDGEKGHAKATIAPGPNNPVGVVWVDLSKPHYGIHGTPEPRNIGKTQSHGCIRLSNWDAQLLAAAVRPGMPALLRR